MKINKKVFLITAILGVALIGFSTTVLLVKNTFGSNLFSTVEKDCVPYNIFVKKGETEYSAKISWSTRKECMGFIQYGSQRDSLSLVAVDQVNKVKSKTHEVTLVGLLTSQKYYFLINSDDQAYGYDGSALDFSLNTL